MRHAIVALALFLPLLSGAPAMAKNKLHAGAMTIDGQTVRDVACELDTGGLGAVMKVVGTLSKQKKTLDACAPDGAAFRVKWTWTGKKATAVEVVASSLPAGAACIVKALQSTQSDNAGDCQATVLVGQPDAAAKAADALAAPAK